MDHQQIVGDMVVVEYIGINLPKVNLLYLLHQHHHRYQCLLLPSQESRVEDHQGIAIEEEKSMPPAHPSWLFLTKGWMCRHQLPCQVSHRKNRTFPIDEDENYAKSRHREKNPVEPLYHYQSVNKCSPIQLPRLLKHWPALLIKFRNGWTNSSHRC